MPLLKNNFSKKYILDLLEEYNKNNPSEKIDNHLTSLKKSSQVLVSRKNFLGHITASALVIDNTLSKILLVQHKRLNKYIQPGGHIDTNNESFYLAAQRELEEETGLANMVFVPFNQKTPDLPIDFVFRLGGYVRARIRKETYAENPSRKLFCIETPK